MSSFIQKIAEQAPQPEIKAWPRRLPFEQLLHAVAKVYGTSPQTIIAAGRQCALTKPRRQLAYLARAWCGMKAIEIARKLNRDASMVSRLCGDYETAPTLREKRNLLRCLPNNSQLILLKNPKNASTGLSMNGKSPIISTAPPFVLRFSKDERRVFQQNHNSGLTP